MKTQKTLFIAALMVTCLALAGLAEARGNGTGMRQPHGNMNAPMFSQLSPEKQKAVDSIMDKHQQTMRTLHNDFWVKRTELDALVRSGLATKQDIKTLVNAMAKLRLQMQEERDSLHEKLEKATGLQLPRPRGMSSKAGMGKSGMRQGCDRGMSQGFGQTGCGGFARP